MNNRSSVNESNLVNFSAELPTLNQLDTKDGLLTFPFDHIYACHSEGSDRSSQPLQLDKEVEITTHCVVGDSEPLVSPVEVAKLHERLASFERQNKALKDLLVYHLDLIQQQNELISKRDKLHQAVQQENETLKNRLTRADRRVAAGQRQSVNSPPLVLQPPTPPAPAATVTSNTINNEPAPPPQIMLNSFTELLLPDNRTKSYIFESDLNETKPFAQDSFAFTRKTPPEVSYLTNELSVSKLLSSSNLNCDKFTMIDNKRSYNVKKEIKTEKRPEPMYTVTSNSGNPIIQRVQRSRRRTASGLGSMSRMPKPAAKVESKGSSNVHEANKSYGRFSVNKKSKMINTYSKSKCSEVPKKTSQVTGSLSDRLRLIDTTPTGEDPYLLGEAEMREQSPIPKLMLQKSSHGRMKVRSESSAITPVAAAATDAEDEASANAASMRYYESLIGNDPKHPTDIEHIKLGKYNLTNTYVHPEELTDDSPKPAMLDDEIDAIKAEPQIDWRSYNLSRPGNQTSLCDFSYGETSNNLASSMLPSLDSAEFQDLFTSDAALNLESLSRDINTPAKKTSSHKINKRGVRTNSLINTNNAKFAEGETVKQPGTDNKPSRKRALSATGIMKTIKRETPQKIICPPKSKPPKGKGVCRGKKSPVPGMSTQSPYHTLVGDPDLSWYLGLDPDVKMDDIDSPNDSKVSTVEVPRWREKPYTSCYTLEGTENLDDKVFEKRHQKLEAEERRQLRWHMRRVREQRHMERLRQRHRDAWCSSGSPAAATGAAATPAAVYTVWPQPQRDARFIHITNTLPVMAFGEILPALPDAEFFLPWVKTSKALKISKRSRTLY